MFTMLCSFQVYSKMIQLYIQIHIHLLFRIFSHIGHKLLSRVPSSIQQVLLVFVVQLLSCVQFFVTPWTAAYQAPLSSTPFCSLFKFMSIECMVLSIFPELSRTLLYFMPAVIPKTPSFSLCQLFRSFRVFWIGLSGFLGPQVVFFCD